MPIERTQTLAETPGAIQAALLPPQLKLTRNRDRVVSSELPRLPRLYPPVPPSAVDQPELATAPHHRLRAIAVEIQLRVMNASTMSRAADAMLAAPGWPVTSDLDAEHRGHFARLIASGQTAHREALALLHQLLDEMYPAP